ncbi:hypothetical protein ACFQ6C_07625 [Streptomyces sp. NPDC056454]|uniref:hypothetical protein n=1 Tax=Streptomyces sp. NPDC056454 TaxID=3345823 RepID=UPI0036ACD612
MSDRKPIVPTRIIPGGASLPPGPPPAGAVPPWRAPAPAPAAPTAPPPAPPAVPAAAPAPPAPPIPQVHVHFVAPYYEEPEPTRRERLWAWVTSIGRPWQIALALTLAFLPIPGVGYSVATIWASCVTAARAEFGQANAYALALTPLAIAVMRIVRGGGTLRRLLLLAISLTGLMGAIDLYDPVTWITGVRP